MGRAAGGGLAEGGGAALLRAARMPSNELHAAAADGRAALEKLQSKKYNLVSMDNQMPNDLSGVEFVEAARRAKYEGCVVLCHESIDCSASGGGAILSCTRDIEDCCLRRTASSTTVGVSVEPPYTER